MTLKKVLQIVSFGLLLYLLADSFLHFDFAASKNRAFTIMQKMEIDTIQSIATVKQKAKDHLDTIRRVHKEYSDNSVINFWVLVGLIIIQTFLFINKHPKNYRE
jgi:hypothetical protein